MSIDYKTCPKCRLPLTSHNARRCPEYAYKPTDSQPASDLVERTKRKAKESYSKGLYALDNPHPLDGWEAGWDACSQQNADLSRKVRELEAERDAYRRMIAKARHGVVFKYHYEVDITVYPRRGKSILHYRDREGDWLNDPTVDTDFTGDRKWKSFNSPLEAFAALEDK